LYGFSFVVFFKLVEIVYDRRVAIFSLLAYSLLFFWIAYVPFSISFITFIIEMFFLNLSLFLLILAIKGRCSFIWGIVFYLFASMSKEAPLIIIPATISTYLFTEWRDLPSERRKGSIIVILLMWLFGITGVIISPFSFRPSSGLMERIIFIHERWNFYADHLLSYFGILIWISTFYLILKDLFNRKGGKDAVRGFYVPVILALLISLILRPFHDVALLALFIGFVPLILKRFRVSFAIIWFAVALSGFIMIEFMSRTYLTDASFGVAIVVGVAISEIMSDLNSELRRLPSSVSRALLVILFIIAGLVVYGFTSKVKDKLEVLRVVSETRENFRDVIEFISANLNKEEITIIVIDYDEMGLSSDYQAWLHLSDLERAHLQKTMKGDFMERWLRNIVGKKNIHVYNLQWFYEHPEVEGSYLFAMNNYEKEFVENQEFKKDIIYKVERDRESAVLYYIHK
jgi:hypothetical protein